MKAASVGNVVPARMSHNSEMHQLHAQLSKREFHVAELVDEVMWMQQQDHNARELIAKLEDVLVRLLEYHVMLCDGGAPSSSSPPALQHLLAEPITERTKEWVVAANHARGELHESVWMKKQAELLHLLQEMKASVSVLQHSAEQLRLPTTSSSSVLVPAKENVVDHGRDEDGCLWLRTLSDAHRIALGSQVRSDAMAAELHRLAAHLRELEAEKVKTSESLLAVRRRLLDECEARMDLEQRVEELLIERSALLASLAGNSGGAPPSA